MSGLTPTMGLETYKRKRHFEKTPEPSGEEAAAPAGDSFTIQRHAARRLHYDFRLELDGVLKSWAVPKGPSLDPREKRLAVEVEDHPLAYGGFEGEIPRGEYGAGTVVLWERGRWKPEGDAREGLRRGKLVFTLEGRKLRGRWALIRLRGSRAGGPGKTNWLLIKENDEFARPREQGDVLERRPESVAPQRASGPPRVWRSSRPAGRRPRAAGPRRAAPRKELGVARLPGARKAPMPATLEPQLCTLVDAPPQGEGWLHELKLDGYRLVGRLEAGQARLFTRRGNDWSAQFAGVRAALERLGARQALLDGEVVALDAHGRPSFQDLQNALSFPNRPLYYYVFDLLYLDGFDLRDCPLRERKKALARLLAGVPEPLKYCDHLEGAGGEFFEQACAMGLEGVVSKRADGPYVSRRTRQWLKIKCLKRQELVVGGYTEPKGSRAGFGALLLGYHQEGRGLVFCGKVGTGFDDRSLKTLWSKLQALERPDAPFSNPPRGFPAKGVHWVEPSLVAEVAYSELTGEGIVRHPRFEGLREDKPAAEVRLERPKPVEREAAQAPPRATAQARPAAARSVFGGLTLSSPDRVLFPEMGLTKRELAAYYEAVAEPALRLAARRPLALVRCPMGRHRHCFFQKHVGDTFPPAVKGVPITEKDTERTYLYIEDLGGLIALVQMGVLEYHPWGSRVEALERPDTMTFDLDPAPDVPWAEVVRTARELRARLSDLGLSSWVKTTGGKGLHVVVPVLPAAPWDEFKAFSKAVVERMVRDDPSRYTAKLAKASRAGKIFVDYLRNGRGATAVAGFSTRARPGAPVSTPLSWDELSPKLKPESFDARTVPRRLRLLGRGDPWEGYWAAKQSLTEEMKRELGLI